MSGDLKDMIKYGYQPKQYVKNNSKQHVKKNSQTDEERQDIIASYQDNKQGKISDPNKIQFLKILNKVTSSTYKEPIRIVKYLADDIRNNKPDSYIKHEIDEKKKKITSVEDLLRGIIVVSGNDACVALAEGIAGSEEEFAIIMTTRAKEIGMENTNFSNSSGINDPDNYSTVRDILKMSRYLIENYPKFYEYYKEKEFTWDRTGGDPITQGNRNPLLYKNFGADGIKTGYLAVERYSLASSIKRKNRRLIGVGSGFKTKRDRSRESAKLLKWGMTNFDLIEVAKKNRELTELEVWLGQKNTVKVYVKQDIYKTIPKARKRYIKAVVEYDGPIEAPIKKNDKLGKLNLFFKDELIKSYNLLSLEDVKKVNIFTRLIKSINYLIWGDV